MSFDPSIFTGNFEAVAAQAAGFELQCRLTADVSKNATEFAVDGKMEKILGALKEHHGACLSGEEWAHLDKCRKIRNKLFHGELHSACALVQAPAGGVVKGIIPADADGGAILSAIEKTAIGGGVPVYGTTTRQTGVYGWLIEANMSGAMQAMHEHFKKARSLMDTLLTCIHNQQA